VVTSPISENQRILASAGSGKTTTITARIAYLVEYYDIDPSNILLVTFSRAAAQEMIHRVYNLIGAVNIYAGTFHALSAQILRDMAPKMMADQPFIDELPYRLVKWLETDRAKKWVQRFRTIIVDEFQDINDIQWQLLKGFYHQWATMSIVGDDAQNIYTWRGSSVDYILNFHNFIPRVKDYQLCMNYRSTEAIVTCANSIMRFIPTLPFKEKMVAYARGGRKPEVHFFFRASDEYDWIVNSLERFIKNFTGTGKPNLTFAVDAIIG
jgi:superfamily I DNA/RNA helicase